MPRLDGKIALVTGSTRGLGEAIAKAMAAEGAKVAVSGRTEEAGRRVVDAISEPGGTACFVRLDLSDEASVKSAADEVAERLGPMNVLVNNAVPSEYVTGAVSGDLSVKVDDTVTEVTTENWRKITTPGIDGLMWMLKYSIPQMQQAGGGSIINISSTASIRGVGGLSAYTAIKGAMNALTLSVAVDYQPHIRCNCIILGPFRAPALEPLLADPVLAAAFNDTVLTPEIGRPEQLAATAVFFATDESSYITGQLVPVDGGFSARMPVPKIQAPATASAP